MATVGRITAMLGLDKSNFDKGIKNSRSSLMAFAGKGATLLAGAFAAKKIFDGLSFGVKLAAEAEKTESAFTTMLGSAQAAKSLLGEIENFAASTPFQLDELNAGAKTLLAFGVSQDAIIGRMRMLGDIAAGTGKPIGDFVQIFGKVKATGKVTLESLNQLAERGVPIYAKLAEQLGVNEQKMLKMISSGKVGFADLDKALQKTTNSGGIFAGGMAKQSETAAGLWSTFKDNAQFAIRDVGAALMDGLDFKGLLKSGIAMAQGTRQAIGSLKPVFVNLSSLIRALMPDTRGTGQFMIQTFQTVVGSIATGIAFAEFAFKNWQDVAMLAFSSASLQAVRFFGELSHFFYGVLPATFDWFTENFGSIWFTAFDYATTLLINFGKNVRNNMKEIWDYIKTGGINSMEMSWIPLAEGFKNTISELPDIPKREIGILEAQLEADVARMGEKVGSGFADFMADKQAKLDALTKSPDIAIQTPDVATGQDSQGGTKMDLKDVQGAAGMSVGSAETLTALAKARSAFEMSESGSTKNPTVDVAKKQLKQQEKTNELLGGLALKSGSSAKVERL